MVNGSAPRLYAKGEDASLADDQQVRAEQHQAVK